MKTSRLHRALGAGLGALPLILFIGCADPGAQSVVSEEPAAIPDDPEVSSGPVDTFSVVMDGFAMGFPVDPWMREQLELTDEHLGRGFAPLTESQNSRVLDVVERGRLLSLLDRTESSRAIYLGLYKTKDDQAAAELIQLERTLLVTKDADEGIEGASYAAISQGSATGFTGTKLLLAPVANIPIRIAVLRQGRYVAELTFLFQEIDVAAVVEHAAALLVELTALEAGPGE